MIPIPMPILIPLVSALVSGALAFGGAWKIQNWRIAEKEKERAEQALAAQAELRALDARRASVAIAAQDAAMGRAVGLRNAANGARTSLVSLSNAADQALREADASHAACTERAAALSGLLTDSTKEYREMGEKAARHVSDIQTLIDAWPKE